MGKACPIHINYESTTEKIYIEKVSAGIYRCLESCIFIDFITYGCEIEVEEADGKLTFLGLYKESPFEIFRYIWPREIVESVQCEKMKNKIVEIGGYWESAMGGLFFIHLPKDKIDRLDCLFEILKAE
ncbi:MAG: hypothetical protein JNN00_16355 [Chitinophagaceae bacterium]|nr:hypothetical protein [Chitinophagaceae bacterium]